MNEETQFFTNSSNIRLAYNLSLPSIKTNLLAIISHPLGRLGGSSQDHVVCSLQKYLLNLGFGVLTYDSRGSGESGGSASFSSIPEAEDYTELVELILLPLFPTSRSSKNILICAGYSAGSLYCSYYTPRPNLIEKYNFETSYILISYPLSVLWALTLFNLTAFKSKLVENVSKRKVIAIWGDLDQFSSSTKLRNWSNHLLVVTGGDNWKGEEIQGADHFWRGEGKAELLEVIGEWVKEIGVKESQT